MQDKIADTKIHKISFHKTNLLNSEAVRDPLRVQNKSNKFSLNFKI